MNQLIINLDGLSPALVNDLKKVIAEKLFDSKYEISQDLKKHWPEIDDSVKGKIQMTAWRDAAHTEHIRFCKEYPR